MTIPLVILICIACAALAALWFVRRRSTAAVSDPPLRAVQPAEGATATAAAVAAGAGVEPGSTGGRDAPAHDAAGHPFAVAEVHAQTRDMTERLWRHAFGDAPIAALSQPDERILSEATRQLESAELAARHFPRRPMLMPELLHALNDPQSGPARLASIVAQDPVLTADVVRLANSAFHRVTPEPVETPQRAIVMCGSDGLQSLVATALLQPVFRGSSVAFPRFPTLLWERAARSAAAAEAFVLATRRGDRGLAPLGCLLRSLGPLVIYRVLSENYARGAVAANARVFLELLVRLGITQSWRIARAWELPPRVVAALTEPPEEAIAVGEFFGTLSVLEAQGVLAPVEPQAAVKAMGVDPSAIQAIRERLAAA